MKIKLNISNQTIYIYSLILMVYSFLIYSSSIFAINSTHLLLFNYFLLLICFFKGQSKKEILLIFTLFNIPLVFTALIFPSNISNAFEAQRIQLYITSSIPVIIVTSLIHDYGRCYLCFRKFVFFLEANLLILLFLYAQLKLQFSPDILGVIASICGAFFVFDKIKYFPFIILNFAIIIQYGQRNPMIVLAIALFIRFLNIDYIKKKPIISFFCIMLGLFSILNIDMIFDALQSIGVTSRTLKLFSNGELATHLSGRDEIYSVLLNNFVNYPFNIYGIFGDRTILLQQNLPYVYAHNLFLEIICEFGVFIGGGIIISLFYMFLKTYLLNLSLSVNILEKCFLSIALGMLLFNNSFWSFPFFWIYIIIFLKRIFIKRKMIVKF